MNSLHQATEIRPEQDGRRLDRALAELFPDYSRSRLKQWILDGRVALDGQPAIPRTRVRSGQRVELAAAADDVIELRPQPIDIPLIYEDQDLLVVDKPAGLVVHPGAGNADSTLVNGLLHLSPELAALPRAGLIHRLDKDTSGVLLVARSIAAHTQLIRDLEARRIRREYRAICVGRITAGSTIDVPIGRHPTHRTRMSVNDRGKPAITHIRVLARFPHHSFLAVRLETGRTHQIRVHMAHSRHALVGDPVYGGRLRLPSGTGPNLERVLRAIHRQALHANRISFRHPCNGTPVDLRAPLPADLLELLHALAGARGDQIDFEGMLWPEQDRDSA